MRIRWPLVVVALLLQSCGVPRSSGDFDQTPEARYLKATVERLGARDFPYLEAQLDERVRQPGVRQGLEQAASALPPGLPTGSAPVTWNVFKTTSAVNGASSRTSNVAVQYTYPSEKWVVVSAQLSGEPGDFRIVGLHVQALPAPLAELNAFTFKGKGVLHYLFFTLAASAPIICIFAFVQCLRTRGLKRKWLWAIFTLVGIVAFTLNWSTGSVSIDPLRFNLLSAAFTRAGWLGPWGITLCVPVGAILFLWRHRRPALVSATDA